MTTRRQRRVAELLHEEISILIQQHAHDPRLALVTVTGVEVTPDLRQARVYVSVMGDEEVRRSALQGLARAKGFFRHELGTGLNLRFVPDLTFHLDESLDRGQRIDALLDQLSHERES
jgi:ribosome-binding factor A